MSERVSWIVLVAGFAAGLAALGIPPRDNTADNIFLAAYFFALLMQFHDGMRWRQIKGKSSFLSDQSLARVGYTLNVMQVVVLGIPVVAWMAYRVYNKKKGSIPRLVAAVCLLGVYSVCVLGTKAKIEPAPLSCSHHISFPWWEGRVVAQVTYVVALLGLLAVLFLDDIVFGGLIMGYVSLTLAMSMKMDASAVASLWCLMFAGVPVLLIGKKLMTLKTPEE